MLIFNMQRIGNNLLKARKKLGLTQAQVAEKAGLSDRTYADIERGSTNMRTETLLHICKALQITPDSIFTESTSSQLIQQEEIIEKLNLCTQKEKETALKLLSVYLDSINM